MILYSLIIFACFLAFLYYYERPANPYILKFFFISIALILCFGYMCGSDWRAYEEIYNSYYNDDFWWRFLFVEPSYLCLNVLGNLFHLGFWPFYIVLKLLIFYKIVDVFKEYCPSNLLMLAFTFYLGFWGIMIFIDPPFRNMLAVYVFLFSLKSLKERRFGHYLGWTLLATSFHYSALIVLLFYFLVNIKVSNKSIIIVFIAINLLLLDPSIVFFLLAKALSFIPAIALKIEGYTVGEEAMTTGSGKLLSVGFFVHTLFLFIILYSRNRIEQIQNGRFIFNMSVLFVFIFRIGLSILIFSRIQLYISMFYAIAIAYSLYSFKRKFRLFYVCCIFFVSIISNKMQMSQVFFVPYTNYLFYFDKDLPYEYRERYNLINSPYK